MKHVLKCDFCIEIMPVDKAQEMESHEKVCILNPANKLCYSCMNLGDSYGMDMCGKGASVWKTINTRTPCDEWIPKSLK